MGLSAARAYGRGDCICGVKDHFEDEYTLMIPYFNSGCPPSAKGCLHFLTGSLFDELGSENRFVRVNIQEDTKFMYLMFVLVTFDGPCLLFFPIRCLSRRVEPRLFLDRESHMSQYSESFAIERFGAFWLDSVYSVELPEDAEPADAEGMSLLMK